MEKDQVVQVFLITFASNLVVNYILSNNLFYFLITILMFLSSLYLGIVVENKYNIIYKISNISWNRINNIFEKEVTQKECVDSDSDEE
jgi:hypothetical protein